MHALRTACAALLEALGLRALARWVRPAAPQPQRGGSQGEEQ